MVGGSRYRFKVLSCAVLILLTSIWRADRLAADPGSLPPDAQLDARFSANDWRGLTAALSRAQDDRSKLHVLGWLRAKLDAGAGTLIAFAYAHDLWVLGQAYASPDPQRDLRVSASLITLYALELVIIDGTMCDDATAPARREQQLLAGQNEALTFARSLAPATKTQIVNIAIAMEGKTAPLRSQDDLLCRGGIAEMREALARGDQARTQPGQYGRQDGVASVPDWVPRYTPTSVYQPKQKHAREVMRANLSRLIGAD